MRVKKHNNRSGIQAVKTHNLHFGLVLVAPGYGHFIVNIAIARLWNFSLVKATGCWNIFHWCWQTLQERNSKLEMCDRNILPAQSVKLLGPNPDTITPNDWIATKTLQQPLSLSLETNGQTEIYIYILTRKQWNFLNLSECKWIASSLAGNGVWI